MRIFSLVALLLSITFTNVVHAKSNKPCNHNHAKDVFSSFDKDANGKVTLKEFKAHIIEDKNIKKRFATLDKNNDGVLDIKEVNRSKRARHNKHRTH